MGFERGTPGNTDLINREIIQPATPSPPIGVIRRQQVKEQGGELPNKYDEKGNLLVAEAAINLVITRLISTTASQVALQQNPFRKYLLLQNNGADFVVINFSNDATITNGIRLPANGVYELLRPTFQSVHIVGNVAGIPVIIVEGN